MGEEQVCRGGSSVQIKNKNKNKWHDTRKKKGLFLPEMLTYSLKKRKVLGCALKSR